MFSPSYFFLTPPPPPTRNFRCLWTCSLYCPSPSPNLSWSRWNYTLPSNGFSLCFPHLSGALWSTSSSTSVMWRHLLSPDTSALAALHQCQGHCLPPPAFLPTPSRLSIQLLLDHWMHLLVGSCLPPILLPEKGMSGIVCVCHLPQLMFET